MTKLTWQSMMDPFWHLANGTQKWGQYWILLMIVHCFVLVARLSFNPPETTTSWTEMRPARETLHWLNHHKDHDCRFLTSRNCAATWDGFRTLVPSVHTPPSEKGTTFPVFLLPSTSLVPSFYLAVKTRVLQLTCKALNLVSAKGRMLSSLSSKKYLRQKKTHVWHVLVSSSLFAFKVKKNGGRGGTCGKFKA